jgi:hypothetical protein
VELAFEADAEPYARERDAEVAATQPLVELYGGCMVVLKV